MLVYPQLEVQEIYKRGLWTSLLQEAQAQVREGDSRRLDLQPMYLRAITTRLLGCDAQNYLQFLLRLLQRNFALSAEDESRLALMCHYDFWQQPGGSLPYASVQESLCALQHPQLQQELAAVLRLCLAQAQHLQSPMPDCPENPIWLHARYSREQILVGFGASTFAKQPASREGVFRLTSSNTELLFVTLEKVAAHFSPSTQYHDYAINETLFHWQSQNASRPDRGRGREYVEQQKIGKRIFLFVREANKDAYGRTLGFVNFGEVDYVAHTGSQPMNITWRLHQAMPNFMWQQAAKLAVG